MLGIIALLLTQCSSPKLNGQIIYNEDVYARSPVLLDLTDMTKHNIMLPPSHQVSVVEITGTLDLFRPTLERFAWSHSGEYVAFPCLPKDSIYLTVCVWNSAYITLEDRTTLQVPRSYPLTPPQPLDYIGSVIRSVSWSPDDQMIMATARQQDYNVSPCLIELSTQKVECGINTVFWEGFSKDDLQILSGTFQISWSPIDKEMLAISLRKNWRNVFDDGKVIIGGEELERFTSFPTGDYPEGIYLVDVRNKFLKNIWATTDNQRIDIDNKLLWMPNGKNLTFVSVDVSDFDPEKYTENYVVMNVEIHGNKEIELFDGKKIMKEIWGDLPESYRAGLPMISLGAWSSDGRYLLFEINLQEDKNNTDADAWTNYLTGGFVYDTKIKSFYKLIDYLLAAFGGVKLNPDWRNGKPPVK